MPAPDWDAKYAQGGLDLYGREPNEYVREITARSDFGARSALCIADGNGRNSSWLASRGLQTSSVDLSATAVAQARALDEERAVVVDRCCADLANWSAPASAQFDAVFILYLQCDVKTRHRAIERGVAALAPGGWLVVEAFAKAQAALAFGPSDIANLYDLAELGRLARGLEIVEALEGSTQLKEGTGHNGEARVVRLAARRPLERR